MYKHTSPSGKVYIGIAKDPKHRWRANGNGYRGSTRIYYAIKKYGWDSFKHEILADGLSREEAARLEIETIRRYKSTDPRFGYNLDSGGVGGFHSEQSIQKIRNSLAGHPVSDEVKKRLSDFRSIAVICLDTGEVFKNAYEAGERLGVCAESVSKVCNGRASTAGGLRFAKLSDYENRTIPEFASKPLGKSVMCIETGEAFKNQREAAKIYGVSSQAISNCCRGITNTCAKFHWRFC